MNDEVHDLNNSTNDEHGPLFLGASRIESRRYGTPPHEHAVLWIVACSETVTVVLKPDVSSSNRSSAAADERRIAAAGINNLVPTRTWRSEG